MGIKGLSQLLSDNCPDAVKEDVLKNYFSRKIAIDASMTIYQFLISIKGAYGADLQNENGEVTNHIQGLLYRTTKMLEYGIKPVFVFDGKPPEMKGGEVFHIFFNTPVGKKTRKTRKSKRRNGSS
jgi:flap endonuclease-1